MVPYPATITVTTTNKCMNQDSMWMSEITLESDIKIVCFEL